MSKKTYQSIAFTLVFLFAGTLSGYAQNILTNGNFSSGLSGWTVVVTGTGLNTSTVTTGSGNNTPPLVGSAAILTARGFGNIASISQPIAVTANSTYRMALGSSANRPSGLTLEVKISDGITDIINALPINSNGPVDNLLDIPIPAGFGSSATFTLIVTNTIGTVSRTEILDNVELVVLN